VTALVIILTLLALIVAGFCSAVAKAFQELSLAKLEERAARSNKSPSVESILANEQCTVLAAESLRVVFTALAVAGLAWRTIEGWQGGVPAAALLATFAWIVLIVFALWALLIWIPSALVRIWAEQLILSSWPVWNIAAKVFGPALLLTRGCEKVLRMLTGHPEAPSEEEELEEELKSIVTEGHLEGIIEEEAREMIESVIELSDVTVAEVMTPRTYMVTMPIKAAWDEVVRRVIESGHTRIPVFGASRDEIIGIVHAKDVLAEMARPDASRKALADILRKPFFVPEGKKVDELLEEFQKSRNHIAIVVNEYGSVSGLVTIEDAIEEIVGEIADEHDEALVDGIKCTGDATCEALARVHIDEINRRLRIALPEDQEFDTLGGFLFHELGRIPAVGEELTHGDVRFRILDAGRRRIDRVSIEVLRPQEEKVGKANGE
jgi:CBS domain containing-hemolysin-like protein